MAKRIEMIAPFEVLRGNLSGTQKLQYAENNNPAFDAPIGRVNYARNYKTRYIGAKRGSDGLTYFAVRQRNGVNSNVKTKLAMALLGGAGALRAGILNDEVVRAKIEQKYEEGIASGYITGVSFSKYVFQIIYRGLQRKYAAIPFLVPDHGQTNILNPWVYTNQQATGDSVDISDEVLVKFWPQLASNPIVFSVSGMKGVAHLTDSFSDLFPRPYNVLGLTAGEAVSTKIPVKLGDLFVCFDYNGVKYQAIGNRDIKDQLDTGVETLNFYLSETIGQIPD